MGGGQPCDDEGVGTEKGGLSVVGTLRPALCSPASGGVAHELARLGLGCVVCRARVLGAPRTTNSVELKTWTRFGSVVTVSSPVRPVALCSRTPAGEWEASPSGVVEAPHQ